MKRYIAVPSKECEDGVIPIHIMDRAKASLLEIVVSDNYNIVEIMTVPEIEKYDYDKKVRENYIWKFDITNEFINLDNDIYIEYKKQKIKPLIKEKHKAYFRTRFNQKGIINFRLINKKKILFEGKIEVI